MSSAAAEGATVEDMAAAAATEKVAEAMEADQGKEEEQPPPPQQQQQRGQPEQEQDQEQEEEEQQVPGSSLIVRFYRDGAEDCMQRTLREMLQYDDVSMERCHDHMQWMFPLHEPSMFSDAEDHEVITPLDAQQLSSSPEARANMVAAAAHFRAFLGLGPTPEPRKWRAWARCGNHNLLRVTRVIRSLRLFGLEEEAQQMYDAVEQVARKTKLPDSTLQYWTTALKDPPMASLRKSRSRGQGAEGPSDPRTILEMLLGRR